jgi:hypothetical protein
MRSDALLHNSSSGALCGRWLSSFLVVSCRVRCVCGRSVVFVVVCCVLCGAAAGWLCVVSFVVSCGTCLTK